MTTPQRLPVDVDTAHEAVREQLNEGSTSGSTVDPRLAAAVCLTNGSDEQQADGAALLAMIADDDALEIVPAMYDLSTNIDASERQTRAHAMGAFEVAASTQPGTAIELFDSIIERLDDRDPLVREAAVSTAAWLLGEVKRKPCDEFFENAQAVFRPAIDSSLTILTADHYDLGLPWDTTLSLSYPTQTFRGKVEAGVSRRDEIVCQATRVVALLADWFPKRVAAHHHVLANLVFSDTRAETRGYAVDALARADIDDELRNLRDQARQLLRESPQVALGVETLNYMTVKHPDFLGAAVPDLIDLLDDLNPKQAALAVKTILYAAANDLGISADPIGPIIENWLCIAECRPTQVDGVNRELIADVATTHPGLVLPRLACALDRPLLSSVPDPSVASTQKSGQCSQEWAADRAWDVLLTLAEQDRQLVWNAINTNRLREALTDRSDQSARLRRFYAQAVPVPPSEEDLLMLFDALVTESAGARKALSTLLNRAPRAVIRTAITAFDGTSVPCEDAFAILRLLSDHDPQALADLQNTLRAWNNDIQPVDSRWSDLVTVRGRIAIAIDDQMACSHLLHIEDVEYCTEFLQTAVASDLIRAMPHKAVPSLLNHLRYGGAEVCEQVLNVFQTLPSDYGGWGSRIRDSVIARATDENESIRLAAVETLGKWLETANDSSQSGTDRWIKRVRSVLLERLDDKSWRVRIHTVRALATDLNDETRDRLKNRLSCERNYTVRFVIQRVLNRSL